MSANNWRACPACMTIGEAKKAEMIREAEAQYGKIPATEYRALISEAEASTVDEPDETFREDWEIGLLGSQPVLVVSYGGSCDECGLTIEFNQKVDHSDAIAKVVAENLKRGKS